MTDAFAAVGRADFVLVRADKPIKAPLSEATGSVVHPAPADEGETVKIEGVLYMPEGRLTDRGPVTSSAACKREASR